VHLEGEQLQVVLQLREDVRRPLPEEHLPTTALPAQVVDVVDVPHEVRLLQPDDVPVLVELLHQPRPPTRTTKTAGSAAPCRVTSAVAMRRSPEASTAQPGRRSGRRSS